MSDVLLSMQDASKIFKVSTRTLRRWRFEGRIVKYENAQVSASEIQQMVSHNQSLYSR